MSVGLSVRLLNYPLKLKLLPETREITEREADWAKSEEHLDCHGTSIHFCIFFFLCIFQQDLQQSASQFEGAVWNVEHQIYVS